MENSLQNEIDLTSYFLFLLYFLLLFFLFLLSFLPSSFLSSFRSQTDFCVSLWLCVMPTSTLGFVNLFQPLVGTLVLPPRSAAPSGSDF